MLGGGCQVGLSSSSRSEAVWEWIQDSMGCQFVEELRFVSASRPPPRLRQHLLTFFLTYLLTYLLTLFLTYLLTGFLTYLLTFFLTYENQNLTSTASQKKQLCKLYIYLTPCNKSNIHDNFVILCACQVSSPSLHRTAPPKGSSVQRCKTPVVPHTHTPHASDRPAKKQLSPRDAILAVVPQLHLMACANHEARRLPLRFFHHFCVGGPAPHIICLPLVHSILPKRGRSTKDCRALLQLLLALRIWNRPPFICHIPLVSLHDFFHDEHQIPSMCSARRLHAHVHALSTNKSQLVAPHMLNSFGEPIGSPNEDRLRTFHHNLRHGCQTKLTCLHKRTLSQQYLLQCAKSNKKQNAMHKIPLVQTWILVIQIYVCTYTWDIFSDILPDISSDILSDISSDILSDIFPTNLLTLFLMTYLLTYLLTYLSDISSDTSSDILSDISSDILSDISFDILSAISSGISPGILWDISFDLLSGISSDILSDISFDILSDISSDSLSDICFAILSDISSDILSDISSDTLSDISFDILLTSFWHIFWHSFWHIFWHILLTFLLTFFLT